MTRLRPVFTGFRAARRTGRLVFAGLAVLALTGADPSFRFSDENDGPAAAELERQRAIDERLSVECRAALKNQRIMLLVGEREERYGYVNEVGGGEGPLFAEIARRLEALGLNVLTRQEMVSQIAQAEIAAYLNNDQDAALSASRRLGAAFVLDGILESQTTVNPVIGVNDVTVAMAFTLRESGGRTVSVAEARGSSYAGTDDRAMARTLLREQADAVIAQLYFDYCMQAP